MPGIIVLARLGLKNAHFADEYRLPGALQRRPGIFDRRGLRMRCWVGRGVKGSSSDLRGSGHRLKRESVHNLSLRFEGELGEQRVPRDKESPYVVACADFLRIIDRHRSYLAPRLTVSL
jgi:hypothetical protein